MLHYQNKFLLTSTNMAIFDKNDDVINVKSKRYVIMTKN